MRLKADDGKEVFLSVVEVDEVTQSVAVEIRRRIADPLIPLAPKSAHFPTR
jgi:hypothetical protein